MIGGTGTAIDRVDRAVVSSGEHRVVARAAVQAIRPAPGFDEVRPRPPQNLSLPPPALTRSLPRPPLERVNSPLARSSSAQLGKLIFRSLQALRGALDLTSRLPCLGLDRPQLSSCRCDARISVCRRFRQFAQFSA